MTWIGNFIFVYKYLGIIFAGIFLECAFVAFVHKKLKRLIVLSCCRTLTSKRYLLTRNIFIDKNCLLTHELQTKKNSKQKFVLFTWKKLLSQEKMIPAQEKCNYSL